MLAPIFDHDDWQDFKEEAVIDHQLLMLKLTQTDIESWPKLIESHSSVFDVSFALISIEDVKNSNHRQHLKLPGPQKIFSPMSSDHWFALFNLPESDMVLIAQMFDVQFSELSVADKLDLLIPLVLITFAQLLGVIFIVRAIRKPLEELSDTAKLLGDGDFSARANTGIPKPLNKLADSFNFMANQVERTIQEQELMIGAIPHELRTPISRLRFRIELSLKKHTIDNLHGSISEMSEEIDELEDVVENILKLLEIKNGKKSEQDQFSIASLVEPIREYYDTETSHILVYEYDDQVINAHKGLLNQALHNLLQNAFKFTESVCKLSIRVDGGFVVATVEDDGPGVPQELQEDILMPFFRSDKSRNRNTGGVGLGLALANEIAEQHKGVLSVGESPLGGAMFTLRWPHIIKRNHA